MPEGTIKRLTDKGFGSGIRASDQIPQNWVAGGPDKFGRGFKGFKCQI